VKMNLMATIEALLGSRLAFARAVELQPVRLNRRCRGWLEPTCAERDRIADALGADADWLFSAFRIPAPKGGAILRRVPEVRERLNRE
jgi:hypothetical protein